MSKPLSIYLAAKYTDVGPVEMLGNIGIALEAGHEIVKKGHYPFIPHLDCLLAIFMKGKPPKPRKHAHWFYDYGVNWLSKCDAILILNGYNDVCTITGKMCYREWISQGVQLEYEYAKKHKMKIYWKLDEISEVK